MYININTHTHIYIYIARKCIYIYMCVCVCVPIRMLKINGNHAEFRGCLEFSGLRSSTIALQSPSLQLAGRWAWRCTAHPPNCRDFFWVSFFNGPLFWSHCYTYTLHLSHPFFLWKANCSALTMFFFQHLPVRHANSCDLEMFLVLNHIPITWPIQIQPFQWLTVCQYWSSDVGQTEFWRY